MDAAAGAPQQTRIEARGHEPKGEPGWRRGRECDKRAEDPDRLPAVQPSHWTAWIPVAASAEPTCPPTSACPELEGSPRHQVSRFQTVALSAPEPIIATAREGATVTTPAIVSATALPMSSAPSVLKQPIGRSLAPRTASRNERRDRVRTRPGRGAASARSRAARRPGRPTAGAAPRLPAEELPAAPRRPGRGGHRRPRAMTTACRSSIARLRRDHRPVALQD